MTMITDVSELGCPSWVPVPVRHYLAHTVDGMSIRALARQSRVHPSTIMRQVRACEARRDDPLVDAGLRALVPPANTENKPESTAMLHHRTSDNATVSRTVTQGRLSREAGHFLRRLCEPGAMMAVASPFNPMPMPANAPVCSDS